MSIGKPEIEPKVDLLWKTCLSGEFLITALHVYASIASIQDGPWGACAAGALFAYFTAESSRGRSLLRLKVCVGIGLACMAILAVVIIIYLPDMGSAGLRSVMPVLVGFLYLLFC